MDRRPVYSVRRLPVLRMLLATPTGFHPVSGQDSGLEVGALLKPQQVAAAGISRPCRRPDVADDLEPAHGARDSRAESDLAACTRAERDRMRINVALPVKKK